MLAAMGNKLQEFLPLSLTARFAVALHCFGRYCQAHGLQSPEIDVFLDEMWQFPCATDFADWERRRPPLVDVALGDPFSPSLQQRLSQARVAPLEFRKLLSSTVEIVFGSLYGTADYHGSLAHLAAVIGIAAKARIAPPPPATFSNSLYEERHGWGPRLSPRERDRWRYQAYLEDQFERF
jgi:hypothetical protein